MIYELLSSILPGRKDNVGQHEDGCRITKCERYVVWSSNSEKIYSVEYGVDEDLIWILSISNHRNWDVTSDVTTDKYEYRDSIRLMKKYGYKEIEMPEFKNMILEKNGFDKLY